LPTAADNNNPNNNNSSSSDSPQDTDGSVDRSRFTTVIEVRMPDMGSSSTNKVLQWHKAEGDLVRTDDVLCDIETPDFVFGMECEDDELQIMGEILVEAPSGPVPVNQVICTLLHETKKEKKAAAPAAPEATKQEASV
jgi:pyruvate/2-oxoglutarate dehydrogenase complex dihydrolipoamide acyltransferase (E2) component